MVGGKRGQESKRRKDGGWGGLRMRKGGQESFTLYLYISDLNYYTQKAIGGGYIIIPLIFIGPSSF